jgi:hypothetical protein
MILKQWTVMQINWVIATSSTKPTQRITSLVEYLCSGAHTPSVWVFIPFQSLKAEMMFFLQFTQGFLLHQKSLSMISPAS